MEAEFVDTILSLVAEAQDLIMQDPLPRNLVRDLLEDIRQYIEAERT